METSIHSSSAKNRLTQNPLRHPAHLLNYLTSHPYRGTKCCQSFSISCIHHRPINSIEDQYAFRPTGSTTACTHSPLSHNHAHPHSKFIRVRHSSMSGFYIQYITFIRNNVQNTKNRKKQTKKIDFNYQLYTLVKYSKAFSKPLNSTPSDILHYWRSSLNLTCQILYNNWMVDFFNGHSHRTKYRPYHCTKSQLASHKDPAYIGPASYVVNATDLKAIRLHLATKWTSSLTTRAVNKS